MYWRGYFPNLPSYPRFIELMKRAIIPLTIFIQLNSGKRTGIYYMDSMSHCSTVLVKREISQLGNV